MRLCYDCIHIDVDAGWGGTDVTPGDTARLECGKGHWNVFNGMYSGGGLELKDALIKADTCPDYQEQVHTNHNELIYKEPARCHIHGVLITHSYVDGVQYAFCAECTLSRMY